MLPLTHHPKIPVSLLREENLSFSRRIERRNFARSSKPSALSPSPQSSPLRTPSDSASSPALSIWCSSTWASRRGSALLQKWSGDRTRVTKRHEKGGRQNLTVRCPTPTLQFAPGWTCWVAGGPEPHHYSWPHTAFIFSHCHFKNPHQGFLGLPPLLHTLPAVSSASPPKTLST